jgi:hypothetical protein
MSHFAREPTETGFGICAPRALEIRSRFSCCSTTNRFREQLRWKHQCGGTNQHVPGSGQGTTSTLQKHYREPLSLTLLGELLDSRHGLSRDRSDPSQEQRYKGQTPLKTSASPNFGATSRICNLAHPSHELSCEFEGFMSLDELTGRLAWEFNM